MTKTRRTGAATGLTQVKFISRVSDMGPDKIIRIPREDIERIKVIGKKRVLVTLDDEVFSRL